MTSSTAPKLVWRSERIDGIATLTIGTSRIAMNAPTSTTARTSQSPPSDRAPRRTAAKIQRGSARPGWRRPPPRVARLRHADAGPPRQPRALPRLPHARDRRPRANGLRRESGQLPPPAQQRPVADADRAGGRAHARRRTGAARRAAEGPRRAEAGLLISCPDRHGIVAAVSGFLAARDANIVSSAQHSTDPEGGEFFMRMAFTIDAIGEDFARAFATDVAEPFAMDWRLDDAGRAK